MLKTLLSLIYPQKCIKLEPLGYMIQQNVNGVFQSSVRNSIWCNLVTI